MLENALWEMESRVFRDRILPFDVVAARHFGSISARNPVAGKPMSVMDTLIAAVAMGHRATLATRNTRHFEGLGLHLVNPFAVVP